MTDDSKAATVTVNLKSDFGYSSTKTQRISPDQWKRITQILKER